MLSRFHLIPERNGQTDGWTDRQTDRFAISISRVLTRDKNGQWSNCDSLQSELDIEHSCRLPDDVVIFSGYLAAVEFSLLWIKQNCDKYGYKRKVQTQCSNI